MSIRLGLLAVFVLLQGGCAPELNPTPAPVESKLPPGFLEDPPPPPTSNTAILSGGTLLLADGSEIRDSLVVITLGELVAWGRRGELDVPHDSIGIDLSGKWLLPDSLIPGTAAEIRFAATDPRSEAFDPTAYISGYSAGTLTLPPED